MQHECIIYLSLVLWWAIGFTDIWQYYISVINVILWLRRLRINKKCVKKYLTDINSKEILFYNRTVWIFNNMFYELILVKQLYK